jgi:hypothetical protein
MNVIEKRLDDIFDLIQNQEFREGAVEVAKKLNITAAEWNENKVALLMFFANKFCDANNLLVRREKCQD